MEGVFFEEKKSAYCRIIFTFDEDDDDCDDVCFSLNYMSFCLCTYVHPLSVCVFLIFIFLILVGCRLDHHSIQFLK